MKTQDKYLLTVNAYPDVFVIAIDDDMLFHNRFIENLYHSYLFCHQKDQDVSICFAPISVAGELSLYEVDLYKVVTYCKDEASCIKHLQDKNRKLQMELIKKNNRIIRLAREIGNLKRELNKQD